MMMMLPPPPPPPWHAYLRRLQPCRRTRDIILTRQWRTQVNIRRAAAAAAQPLDCVWDEEHTHTIGISMYVHHTSLWQCRIPPCRRHHLLRIPQRLSPSTGASTVTEHLVQRSFASKNGSAFCLTHDLPNIKYEQRMLEAICAHFFARYFVPGDIFFN